MIRGNGGKTPKAIEINLHNPSYGDMEKKEKCKLTRGIYGKKDNRKQARQPFLIPSSMKTQYLTEMGAVADYRNKCHLGAVTREPLQISQVWSMLKTMQ